ncbi:MAG: PEP-CTERM sorting domain-containing protein [Verrucomicrobiales bacterium]
MNIPLNRKHFSLGVPLSLLLSATSLHSAVVFSDSFDNDGSTNTGVGGEMSSGARNGGTAYTDTGDLTASTNFGSHQAWAWTANQFDLSDGFSLDVAFTTVAAGNPSFTFSFGIIDEVTATAGVGGDPGNVGFDNAVSGANAISFGTTTRSSGSVGIDTEFGGTFTEFASLTEFNNALNLGTAQTFNLTVNADGSGSATIDSTTATFTAGTFSGLFDNSTDDEFHFAVYAQGNNDPGGSLQSVTLTTIPEPSSLAMLCLGGFLALRRRRA